MAATPSVYQYARLIHGHTSAIINEDDLSRSPFYSVHKHISRCDSCPYCGSAVRAILDHVEEGDWPDTGYYYRWCAACGWWRHMFRVTENMDDFDVVSVLTKHGIDDDDLPIKELRGYLARHWGDRKHISPDQCEKLVGDVFADVLDGEVVYLTDSVYAKDGGIDLAIIQTGTGIATAFQVKRRQTSKPESVQSVREFIGSLASSKFNHGFFVTTADSFTRDAQLEHDDSIDALKARGIEVNLVDGRAFHDLLIRHKTTTAGQQRLIEHLRALKAPKHWRYLSEGVAFADGQIISHPDALQLVQQ